MKFLKKEDPENGRKKTLLSKRKRDCKISQSQKRAKDNKDLKKIITNGRLTVPHVQTGIFLKGKSTVSHQKTKGAKLNALNKARMNENLAEILKFAKNSDMISVIPHVQENGGKPKFHSHSGDIEDVELIDISPNSSKKIHGRNPYKNKFEIFLSSEDSSEEEKNEPIKLSETASQNASTVKFDDNIDDFNDDDEAFDGESEYIDFKRFLTYFDTHVLQVSLTDLFTTEKKDLQRTLRKTTSVMNPVNSPRNQAVKISSKTDNRFTNRQNEVSVNGVKFSRNVKNTKIKIPTKNPNYYMCPIRKPPKMTIIKQIPGKDVIEASQNSTPKKFPTIQYDSKNFEKDIHKIDSLSIRHEPSPIKHSIQNITHPDSSLSMLDPLHFLEVTMSQPEVTRVFSVSSETSFDETEDLERSVMASANSAPPDLYETTFPPMPHFQEHEFSYLNTKQENIEKKEIFYDLFNPCKINEPSPSFLNCQRHFSSHSKFICHETEDIWGKRSSKEDLFNLFDRKEEPFFPSTSQNFVFSPEINYGSAKEHVSIYSNDMQELKRLHKQLQEEDSPNEVFDHEKLDRYKKFVLSPYHPKIDLSPKSEFEEPVIPLKNFWQRRKMF